MARLGDAGPVVAEVRDRLIRLALLPAAAPQTFDDAMDRAVRAFQQQQGLTVDGLVGPETFRRLEEARWNLGDRTLFYSPGHMQSGDDVAQLQRRLTDLGFDAGRVDGVFGPNTDHALRDFQRQIGVKTDGVCGPDTMRAFGRLQRTVSGGAPEAMRDEQALVSIRTGTADKVIVIDPGHGGNDPGRALPDITEQSVIDDICSRLEGRLSAVGTQVLLSRPLGVNHVSPPSEAERAAFANRVAADLVISVHCDWEPSGAGSGAATYYYGSPRTHSIMGQRFAEQLQNRVVTGTEFADCHTHAKTWDLLRLTRMTAVRLEAGYLSSTCDRARLEEPHTRQLVAESVAEAIHDFFGPA
ncbi:MAG: N-acetylmuramoyl-L-alanine amidase [Candidatus Nanopelagicales bacterium]